MFTSEVIEIANQILVVGGAVAVVLVCVALISVIRLLNRVHHISSGIEQVYDNLLELLVIPLAWMQSKFKEKDLGNK